MRLQSRPRFVDPLHGQHTQPDSSGRDVVLHGIHIKIAFGLAK